MARTLRVPVLDVEFVRRWSPARFAALGLIIYAVLVVVSPLHYAFDKFSLEATVYAVASALCFFGGCQLAKAHNRTRLNVVQPVSLPADRMINIALVLGFVGASARFYDRVVARGFTIADSFLETRETMSESLSPFAYIGGMFFSFGIIAVMLIWLSSTQRRRPFAFALAVLLAIYPMSEALLQASRSVAIHTLFLLFLAARSAGAMRWLVRSPVALFIAGSLVVVGAQFIYELRSTQTVIDERDIVDVFQLTALSEYAWPGDWVVDYLVQTNAQGLLGDILKSWTHLTQYLTHSWLVYCENYTNFEGAIGWGRLHLYLFVRVISALAGEDLSFDPTISGMNSGISATGFSSLYYDFGATGPLVAGLFGFGVTVVQRKAINFPERWLPLHVYFCFTCLMMMLDNQLTGSLGAFAVWTFSGYVGLHYLLSLLSEDSRSASAARRPPGLVSSPALRGEG